MMNRVTRYIVVAIVMIFTANIAFSQSSNEDLLKKAREAGLSEAQIAQYAQQYDKSSSKTNQKVVSVDNLTPAQNFSPRGALDVVVQEHDIEKEVPDSINAKRIFGYGFFKQDKVAYEPNLNIPTPKDYILGVGDEVLISVWGDSQMAFRETITPDGVINLENTGQIYLNGLTSSSAEEKIKRELFRTTKSLGKTSYMSFSIGKIRSIKIHVAGEATFPGTYTVPSFATVLHVLSSCGGTSQMGDMRSIEVFRNSKKVASFDLYAFITAGNFNENIILQDNDVIVIRPYYAKVYASGSVKRQMYYHMKKDESLSSLIEFAGNFSDNAYKNEIRIYRRTGEYKAVFSVEKHNFDSFNVMDGDSLVVDMAKDEFENILTIAGAVWRPGDYQLDSTSNTLIKLIEKSGGLKGDAFATAGIITRRNKDFSKSMIKFNTIDIASGKTVMKLQNYDEVLIPTINSLKEKHTIIAIGELNKPDTLEYRKGMRIEDVIVLAGGLTDAASLSFINISRRINNPHATKYTSERAKLFSFKINENLTINEDTKNFILEPFDILTVMRSPQYKVQATFNIRGSVVLPGSYTISNDKIYLSDIVKISGGLTPNSYVRGARMSRVFSSSDKTLDRTIETLKASITGRDTLSADIGREEVYTVAIDLESAIKTPRGETDILLMEGDIITIPTLTNIVNTLGAVNYPNAMIYGGEKLKYYIESNGGYSKTARKRPFVIYANGSVKITKGFIFKRYPKIEPGCMIVIPMKNMNNRLTTAEIASLALSATSMASTLSTLGMTVSTLGK